jgi:hypothetical protein
VYLGSHHIAGKPVAIKLEPAQIVPKPRPSSRMLKKAASNPNLRLNRHDQRPPLPQSPHLPGTPHNEQHDHRDDHDRRYNGPSPLIVESQIYKKLMGGPGVPWIMYSGKQGDYNVMVIDLLGPSLEDLFKMCNRRWDLKTVLMVADQVVRFYYRVLPVFLTNFSVCADIEVRVHPLPLFPSPRHQALQFRHRHRLAKGPSHHKHHRLWSGQEI